MTGLYYRYRIPAAPLLHYLGDGSGRQHAARTGVTRRTICRWRTGACLTMTTAEHVAERLGVHPVEIWGAEWWRYIECPLCPDESCERCRGRTRAANRIAA